MCSRFSLKARLRALAEEFGEGTKPKKQPYLIHRRDNGIFAFAGLWEEWRDKEGMPIETFTILTTEPNDLVRQYHDRMPAIIKRDDYDVWLDPDVQEAAKLARISHGYSSLRRFAVFGVRRM